MRQQALGGFLFPVVYIIGFFLNYFVFMVQVQQRAFPMLLSENGVTWDFLGQQQNRPNYPWVFKSKKYVAFITGYKWRCTKKNI